MPLGIAHLTLLALSPPELVTTAAEAGFDFVGVRVKAVTDGEHQYPMAPGSPMSRETLLRLYHEVAVAEPAEQWFEYAGCRERTGLLDVRTHNH